MSPLIRISGATVERTLSSAIDGGDFPFRRKNFSDLNEKGEEKQSDELDLNICARAPVCKHLIKKSFCRATAAGGDHPKLKLKNENAATTFSVRFNPVKYSLLVQM
jgi:hypothetical protein